MGGGGGPRSIRRAGLMIVDVLLVAALTSIVVLGVAITVRARRDHVEAAVHRDQP